VHEVETVERMALVLDPPADVTPPPFCCRRAASDALCDALLVCGCGIIRDDVAVAEARTTARSRTGLAETDAFPYICRVEVAVIARRRSRMKSFRMLALAPLALFAGCGGAGETILADQPQPISINRSMQFSGGQQFVEVIGAPPDGAQADAIAASLRAPPDVAETRYVAVAPGGGGARLVLEFGAVTGGLHSCTRPRSGAASTLVVTATLCSERRNIRSATLRSDGLSGPGSPGFEAAMGRLMGVLLSPQRWRANSRS